MMLFENHCDNQIEINIIHHTSSATLKKLSLKEFFLKTNLSKETKTTLENK